MPQFSRKAGAPPPLFANWGVVRVDCHLPLERGAFEALSGKPLQQKGGIASTFLIEPTKKRVKCPEIEL